MDESVTTKYRPLGGFEFLFGAFNVISHNVFRILATRSFDPGPD